MPTKIQGSERLMRKLKALRTQTSAEVRRGMTEAANLVVSTQRRFVPVDQGNLRSSIEWRFDNRGENQTRVIISAGGSEAPYARWIEFGRQNAEAQPFFFPGYRAVKRRAKRMIGDAVRKAVKSAAA